MPEPTTVKSAGEQTVQFRTTGAEKRRCTVKLAIAPDGQKLLPLPYVVLKRKTMARGSFHRSRKVAGWLKI
jgi:hypothetical protein